MATGTLTSTTIAATYKSLLKVKGGANQTLDGTPRLLEDGDGNDSVLGISNDSVLISGSGTRLDFNTDGSGEYISGDGTDLTIAASTAVNITADVIDLSDATKDVTLNAAVDAINFDSNTLSIDASNNRIGFGTAAPSSSFHVTSSTADQPQILFENTTNDNTCSILYFRNTHAGNAGVDGDELGKIFFQGMNDGTATNTSYAYLQAKATDTGTGSEDGEIEFYTEKASTSTSTLMLKSGNVGIGQATPSSDNSSTTFLHIGSSSSDLSGLVLESDENKWEIRESGHLYIMDGTANHLLIKNNGNVGIGSGDPDKLLHLAGSATSVIRLENTGTALGDGDVLGTIEFEGQDSSTSASGVRASISGVTQNTSGGAYLAFSTANSTSSNAEAMRIQADGSVLVGTTTSAVTSLQGTVIQPGGLFMNNDATSAGTSIILCYTSHSTADETKFEVAADGDVFSRTNSFGAFSDERLKEQITDATSQWEDIKAIEVKNFKLISESLSDEENPKFLGVIAQQVELISPSLVDVAEDDIGTKSVKYSILYMKAVKALQEAMTRIETLETKVEALENA